MATAIVIGTVIGSGVFKKPYAVSQSVNEFGLAMLAFKTAYRDAGFIPSEDELPDYLLRGAELAKRERPPWEAEIPMEGLTAAPFQMLVISGDHSPAFDGACDFLAEAVGAERAVISGRGHTIPSTGDPYNERLETFLRAAER